MNDRLARGRAAARITRTIGGAVACIAGAAAALLLAARPGPRRATPPEAVRVQHAAPSPRELTPATLTAGAPDSPHTLVIWSDYECPACALLERAAGPALRELAADGRLRVEVRHLPLTGHRRAPRAAAAAICAERQGRGWAMHEALFASAAVWSSGSPSAAWFLHLADSLRLDVVALERCTSDPDVPGLLAADVAHGRALGLIAVPAAFLDGRLVRFRTPAALVRRVRREVERG